jgi:hypothetical protein
MKFKYGDYVVVNDKYSQLAFFKGVRGRVINISGMEEVDAVYTVQFADDNKRDFAWDALEYVDSAHSKPMYFIPAGTNVIYTEANQANGTITLTSQDFKDTQDR